MSDDTENIRALQIVTLGGVVNRIVQLGLPSLAQGPNKGKHSGVNRGHDILAGEGQYWQERFMNFFSAKTFVYTVI